MSQLRFPLKERLHDPVTERALQRVWRSIDEHAPRRTPRRMRGLALALLALLLGVGLGLVLRVRDVGPLRLADGSPLVAVDATAAADLALDDGSSIRLGPGARLEPLESTGSTFNAVLTRGEARFDVRPGGARRWLIECGLATVEVVGTEFQCARGPHRLRISVERGSVLVRGERVPDRVRRLDAGDSLELTEAPAPGVLDPP